ncbi:MAG: PBPRA1643 family SWIM/SEC-C metal-binding motif protein [Pseudomonadota bacterium]
MPRIFNNEKKAKFGTEKIATLGGDKNAKLGTKKRPAVVYVKSEERRKEIAPVFKENCWEYIVELDPDKPEDITDLETLLNPPKPKIVPVKVSRNESCPCGSGNKYKKCCGR